MQAPHGCQTTSASLQSALHVGFIGGGREALAVGVYTAGFELAGDLMCSCVRVRVRVRAGGPACARASCACVMCGFRLSVLSHGELIFWACSNSRASQDLNERLEPYM